MSKLDDIKLAIETEHVLEISRDGKILEIEPRTYGYSKETNDLMLLAFIVRILGSPNEDVAINRFEYISLNEFSVIAFSADRQHRFRRVAKWDSLNAKFDNVVKTNFR